MKSYLRFLHYFLPAFTSQIPASHFLYTKNKPPQYPSLKTNKTGFSTCQNTLSILKRLFCNAQRTFAMRKGLLQCAKSFCNSQRTFAMRKGLLQCAKGFCNLQRAFAICKELLQYAKGFCNAQRAFAIRKGLLQCAKSFCNAQRTFAICKRLLQIAKSFCNSQKAKDTSCVGMTKASED